MMFSKLMRTMGKRMTPFGSWIIPLTVGFLLLSLILAIWWVWTGNQNLEPLVTVFALLASITGLVIDRWLTQVELRQGVLFNLVHEVAMNAAICEAIKKKPKQEPPNPYLRVSIEAAQSVRASGAFTGKRDRELYNLLSKTRIFAQALNNHLAWTEIYQIHQFSRPSVDASLEIMNPVESTSFKEFDQSNRMLHELLATDYSDESGCKPDSLVLVQSNHPMSLDREAS